jgi:hypothetical protein
MTKGAHSPGAAAAASMCVAHDALIRPWSDVSDGRCSTRRDGDECTLPDSVPDHFSFLVAFRLGRSKACFKAFDSGTRLYEKVYTAMTKGAHSPGAAAAASTCLAHDALIRPYSGKKRC